MMGNPEEYRAKANDLLQNQNNRATQSQARDERETAATESPFQNIEIPTLSLPKGGGAIQGIGEKFQVNPATGTGNFSVPIAMSPGRGGGGMNPEIALSYSSGGGNSPFGMGWNVGLASIVRKTQKELPQYQDYIESDTFILAGAEDLVRTLDEKGNRKGPIEIDGYSVYEYRPRTERLFARIQRWEDDLGRSFWKVTTKDNITTIYGKGDQSPISNHPNPSSIIHPEDRNKVFQWFIERVYDDKGNILSYEYKEEDGVNVSSSSFESNRKANSQVYLKRIVYTNEKPYFRGSIDNQAPEFNSWKAGNRWLFELLFDYGEHETGSLPSYQPIRDWEIRQDIFSSFRSGFDIRTYRLCKSIHLFHHIDDEGKWLNEPQAIKSTSWQIEPSPIATQINNIEHLFYDPDGLSIHKMPPVELCYTASKLDDTIKFLAPESLENLPIGIDGQSYRWIDLYGEGISGILHETEGAWHYKSNLGDGELGPTVLLNTKPSLGVLAAGAALTDIDGDGMLNLVMRGNGINGYYEVNQQAEWEEFQSFSHNPNLDFNDPNLRMLDLNGDGFADILITEHDCFVWHKGMADKGYDAAQFVAKKLDEEQGPRIVFQEGFQSIFLSDMSGDGLTDIVRIRNGEISYWPNLGYGQFGAKIRMADAPKFDYPDLFDPSRIRLADIDGTGTTDILYLGSQEVSYWHNQSGNSFSVKNKLDAFPQIDNIASVQVFDLLGKGTACLVWSSPLAEDARNPIRYLDLMQEKPYLLCESKNNMGAETHITYVSSIKFYLEDKLNGKPWITKLPFAVQVVERSATYDAISNNLFVSKYAYHHGYFDGIEREFRGFGMVEQWDTEDFETLKGANLFPGINPANFGQKELDQAPVYTKTWFHNGFYRNGEHISAQYEKEYYQGDEQAWFFPDTNLPEGISPTEEREAARALKGAMLRQEVYGLDDTELQEHPYTVAENKVHVKQIQSQGDNKYGVYFSCSCESLSYHYERNPEDPRIAHSMTLRQDKFGNPTHTASLVYPRRSNAENLAEQRVMYASINETLLTHTIKIQATQDAFRHSLPLEARSYQLHGIETLFDEANYRPVNKLALIDELPWEDKETRDSFDIAQVLDYAANPTEEQLQLRLLSRARTSYYNNELTNPLPFGEVESLAIPYQSYTLVFTDEILAQEELENKIGESELKIAHYQQGNNLFADGKPTDWWHRPGRNLFDADAVNRFYLPLRLRDPYGYVYKMEYDAHFLFPKKTQDPLGNESSASFNYRYLQVQSLLDRVPRQGEYGGFST
ncbi:MAG: SpvB/TcaC N-terminal domain-containing protein, partial [Bacteroidota bacterium]